MFLKIKNTSEFIFLCANSYPFDDKTQLSGYHEVEFVK